ncbi:hypothetical protein AKJ16_DCAP14804 [Drosera capensis]
MSTIFLRRILRVHRDDANRDGGVPASSISQSSRRRGWKVGASGSTERKDIQSREELGHHSVERPGRPLRPVET